MSRQNTFGLKTLPFIVGVMLPLCLPVQVRGQADATTAGDSLRIEAGDLLHIAVLREPDLDQRVRVHDSGDISLPMIGDVQVRGLSAPDASRVIAQKYRDGQFLKHPDVSVFIEEFASRQVAVLGQVLKPGTYAIASSRSLIDVLAMAGGLTDVADRHLTIERANGAQTAEVFLSNRADDALEANVRVFPGDKILVPRAGIIYVLGDVGRPGGFVMQNESRMTVLQAVAMAAGANRTASEEHVRLVRNKNGEIEEQEIPLKDIERGLVPDLLLQANDVLYVPFSFGRHIIMGSNSIVASASSALIYAGDRSTGAPVKDLALQDIACAAILAFFAMQGAIPFIAPNQALETSNTPASGLMYWGGIVSQFVVYAAICIFACSDLGRVLRWLVTMRWAAAIACLGVASSLWSQFPLFTLRRSVPFALAGLFGLWFALKYPVRRQLSILWMMMVGLALGTIVLAVFFPHVGLDASSGHGADWQGVFTQKNACGRIMVLATAVTLSQRKSLSHKTLSMALFLFAMTMSGSRGAWIVEGAILALFFCVGILGRSDSRSRVLATVFALIATGAIAAAIVVNFAALASLIGRDATLTGRTEIWRHVWPFIMERPLLGWGYAGFWRGIQGESFRVVAAMRFIVFHAHNGFLEIWLELGFAGLFLFACSYFRAWRKLWPKLRAGQVKEILWMFFVLVLIGLYDLDENTLLIYNGLFWVIYVATLVNLELLEQEEQLSLHLTALLTVDMKAQERTPPGPSETSAVLA